MRASVPVLAIFTAFVATVVACSAMENADFNKTDGGAPNGVANPGDGAAARTPTGVMVVHAATLPAFRLCFSNLKSLRPQPDSDVMPNANTVGVEVGSAVRIDPLAAPGEVFVIDQRVVQSRPGTGSTRPCGELICPSGASCLRKNADYFSAGTVDAAVGQDGVAVLAICGCGNKVVLTDLSASSADCGSSWNEVSGNLQVETLRLPASRTTDSNALPIQIVHMSSLAEQARGTGSLDVSFGSFSDGGAMKIVSHNPPLFNVGPAQKVDVDQSRSSVYADHGFRTEIWTGDGGAPAFTVDQSLAAIQVLSDPNDVPSNYYRAGSNYVLLLLGDPRKKPKLDDGGADPNFDARRALHFLAVPVIDPDAGADGGS